MQKILIILLLTPLFSAAQKIAPRFEKDTLYTSSGYKIYKGLTLKFGKPTGNRGNFRYVNIKSETKTSALTDNSIVVKKMKNFGISALGNAYIEILGSIQYKDGSKGFIDIHMAFDLAIENSSSLPSELIVPDEYRNRPIQSVALEISRLKALYDEGVITKEEFEAQKKKLLGDQ